MDELQKTTQETAEKTGVNSDTGVPVKENPLSIIERAEKAAKENEVILKQMREEREKLEMIKANDMLSGRAIYQSPEQPKVLTSVEMANAMRKGELGNPFK